MYTYICSHTWLYDCVTSRVDFNVFVEFLLVIATNFKAYSQKRGK